MKTKHAKRQWIISASKRPVRILCLNCVALSGSPLSVALTYELMKRMAGQSLRTCLETEFMLALNLSRDNGDFVEGVRAVLIDKDRNPKWKLENAQVI